METRIRWYVQSTVAGVPLLVARIREELGGTYPEVWNGREWKEWPTVMTFRTDPLAADEVDRAEAERVIAALARQRGHAG
jgi:hypothetical protein